MECCIRIQKPVTTGFPPPPRHQDPDTRHSRSANGCGTAHSWSGRAARRCSGCTPTSPPVGPQCWHGCTEAAAASIKHIVCIQRAGHGMPCICAGHGMPCICAGHDMPCICAGQGLDPGRPRPTHLLHKSYAHSGATAPLCALCAQKAQKAEWCVKDLCNMPP